MPALSPAADVRRLHRNAQARALREAERRAARRGVELDLLLEHNGADEVAVLEWARRHRLPLPVDGTLPRAVVEFYLLATRHRGVVQIGGLP